MTLDLGGAESAAGVVLDSTGRIVVGGSTDQGDGDVVLALLQPRWYAGPDLRRR